MPCPVSTVLGAGAAIGGVHSLLFQDRRWRWLAWTALLGLAVGWAHYFAVSRTPSARIVLEGLSVAALIAAGLRVRWLVRSGKARPFMFGAIARLLGWVSPVFGSVWVVGAKIWLLAMLVMEWRGKAVFSRLEYSVVIAILAILVLWRVVATRRARSRFTTLETLANRATTTACPLGFGEQRELDGATIQSAPAPAQQSDMVPGRIAPGFATATAETMRQT